MSLLKHIGLGILGLGGISSVSALGSRRVREFIGLSNSPIEEDRKGQFLYKLSQKLFDSLGKDAGSDLSENPKGSVIEGLQDKFSRLLENDDDTWENFKSLCDAQKNQEIKDSPNVDNDYSRLCFLDAGSKPKGYLGEGFKLSTQTDISSIGNAEFLNLYNSNFVLGTSFNNKYPNASPLDKFGEWYSSNDPIAKNLKQVMDDIADDDFAE